MRWIAGACLLLLLVAGDAVWHWSLAPPQRGEVDEFPAEPPTLAAHPRVYTAGQLDRMLPRGDTRVDRAPFYACTRTAMAAGVLGQSDPNAARKAEHDEVIQTLCECGLARRDVR